MTLESLQTLSNAIGYQFNDISLLKKALTHRSVTDENNERLEFLGDSLLNFFIANFLFEKFPQAKEGNLTRLRASLVKGETLAFIAHEFSLGNYLILGAGELKSGGRQRTSILADTVEAIIAAIYLDGGIKICEETTLRWFTPRLSEDALKQMRKDPKTELQEYLQARHMTIPKYHIVATEGGMHNQVFVVECVVKDLNERQSGRGSSRRRAEQEAATKILEKILLSNLSAKKINHE